MALSVNTNVGALNALASSAATTKSLETSMARLASGKRINSAADDAAGVAIVSRLTSEINGLNMAIRNASDGQAMLNTAEGALTETTNILQRMRELAVQSANDTNSDSDRMALNAETTQLKNEIDRIATTSSFAGSKLLDGNFINKNFQIGSGSGETLAVNISSAKTGAIGSNAVDTVAQVGATTATTANIKTAGAFTVAGTVGATQVTFAAGSSVKTVAAAVNAASSSTGVTAQASTTAKISIGQTGTTTFNLKSISGTATGSAAISASIVSISDLTTLRDAINNASGTTGITAAFDGADKSKLVLNDADGDDIAFENVGSSNASTGGTTLSVTAMNFDGSAVVGSAVAVAEGATADTNAVVVTGTMRMDSTASFSITNQHDGTAGAVAVNTSVTGYFGAAATDSSDLTAVSSLTVGTKAGATSAIRVLDAALLAVSDSRSSLGSLSNRLDHTVANLSNVVTNLSAGRGRIEDADFAAESTNLAKAQILSQASTAMLAQANASKQGVLQLLQR